MSLTFDQISFIIIKNDNQISWIKTLVKVKINSSFEIINKLNECSKSIFDVCL